MAYEEYTLSAQEPAEPKPQMVLTYRDGSTETVDYDALIVPPSYIKVLSGDRVRAIHESQVSGFDLYRFPPRDFNSLE